MQLQNTNGYFNFSVTGLEDGLATENVIIWCLAENNVKCKISVASQIAVIKLCYPNILVCGHLDGIITISYLNPTNISSTSSQSEINDIRIQALQRPATFQPQYVKTNFRGHASAVISLEINQVLLCYKNMPNPDIHFKNSLQEYY